jgi:hypothetical protein
MSAEEYQRQETLTEISQERKLSGLIKNEDNMQVAGLALRKVESSDRGIALDAALVKGAMTAKAGVGELVHQVSFLQQRPSNPSSNSANGNLDRLLAESQSRQQELLSRLADEQRL